MSVSIILYNINKKRNSSKQPINTDIYKTVTGNFVDDSSMFMPAFTLSRDEVANVARFNYFSIAWPSDSAAATRYYWVRDKIVQKDGTLKVIGFEDCFATFRSNISAGSYYVKRSSQSYRDTLTDTSFAVTSALNANSFVDFIYSFTEGQQTLHNPYVNDTSGFYILGIVAPETVDNSHITSADTSFFKRGGIRYYEFNHADLTEFLRKLQRMQISHGADYKMTDFIVSCMYIPINPDFLYLSWAGTKNTYFLLSYNEDNNQGYWVSLEGRHYLAGTSGAPEEEIGVFRHSYLSDNTNRTHPQYSTYGSMMNADPFTTIEFSDPVIGSIDLPSLPLSTTNPFTLTYIIDLVTGYINIEITGSMRLRKTISGSVGVPIAITAISTDSYVNRKIAQTARNKTVAASMISPVLGAVGGAMAGGFAGAVVGAAGGLATGIVNTVVGKDQYDAAMYQNAKFDTEIIGSNGTLCINSFNAPFFRIIYHTIQDTSDFVVHPRLTNKYMLGSSLYLNGEFAICENAQLSSNTGLTYDEEQIICDQLNSGFFFE